MKEIITDSCTVLTEKKSKFITRLYKISSVQQVDEILKEIRALEKGATHNCYAWRLAEKQSVAEGRSDDGEPSGTAGQPMLSALSGEDVVNVLAIVTRYFGGIKLGTGGLVRIYSKCVKEALKDSGTQPFIIREYLNTHFIFQKHRIFNIFLINFLFHRSSVISQIHYIRFIISSFPKKKKQNS